MFQIPMVLTWTAPFTIQALVDRFEPEDVCPTHPGTTLDGGECPICEMDVWARDPILNAPAPAVSPWVKRALRNELPAKILYSQVDTDHSCPECDGSDPFAI